jgi:hypothetical protein
LDPNQHGVRLAAAQGDAHIVQSNPDWVAPDHALMQDLNLCALDEADLKQAPLQLALGQGRGPIRGRGRPDLNHHTAQSPCAMAQGHHLARMRR